MQMYWGVGVQLHAFLNFVLDRVVRFMPQPLQPWNMRPYYPLDGRLDGSLSWSGHGSKEK